MSVFIADGGYREIVQEAPSIVVAFHAGAVSSRRLTSPSRSFVRCPVACLTRSDSGGYNETYPDVSEEDVAHDARSFPGKPAVVFVLNR